MSLLAKHPIRKLYNLDLYVLKSEQLLIFKGPIGFYSFPLKMPFYYSKKEKKLWIFSHFKSCDSFLGLSKILLSQAMIGCILGYRRQLNIVGVGYQAFFDSKTSTLRLKLGFSHIVSFSVPASVEIKCPKPRIILLRAMSLSKISNLAALIRFLKCPNIYKEKGIYYAKEKLKLKQGKKT